MNILKSFVFLFTIVFAYIMITSCSDNGSGSKRIAKERGQWFADEQQNSSLSSLLVDMKRIAFEQEFRPAIRPHDLDVIAGDFSAPGEITVILYGKLSPEGALAVAKGLTNLLEGSNVKKGQLLIQEPQVNLKSNSIHSSTNEMTTLYSFLIIPGKSPKITGGRL